MRVIGAIVASLFCLVVEEKDERDRSDYCFFGRCTADRREGGEGERGRRNVALLRRDERWCEVGANPSSLTKPLCRKEGLGKE